MSYLCIFLLLNDNLREIYIIYSVLCIYIKHINRVWQYDHGYYNHKIHLHLTWLCLYIVLFLIKPFRIYELCINLFSARQTQTKFHKRFMEKCTKRYSLTEIDSFTVIFVKIYIGMLLYTGWQYNIHKKKHSIKPVLFSMFVSYV